MSQVPEAGKPKELTGEQVLARRAEELLWLRNRLAGLEVFGRWRGKLGSLPFKELSIAALIQQLLASSASPTAWCTAWDSAAADLRELGNILAQLWRDEKHDAKEALWNALADPAFLIEGEVVPLSKTRPLTLVICDAKVTFEFIRLLAEGNERDLEAAVRGARSGLFEVAQYVLADIPELRAAIVNPPKSAGDSLFKGYWDHIKAAFPAMMAMMENGQVRMLHVPQWHKDRNSDRPVVAFLVPQEQEDVLALWPREDQARLATWQFRFPQVLDLSHYWVGVHPEACHAEWQQGFREPRPWLSAGFSHGLGAVLLPQNTGCEWNFSDAPPYHERYKGQGLAFALV